MELPQGTAKVVKLERSAVLYASVAGQMANNMPLFFQPWWLDAVVGVNAWEPWVHSNGILWPLLLKRKGPFSFCSSVPFMNESAWISKDQHLVPDIVALHKHYRTAIYWQINAGDEQFNRLNDIGFSMRPAFTYQVSNFESAESIWGKMNVLARRSIQKAEKNLQIRIEADSTHLHPLTARSMQRHQLPMRFSKSHLQQIIQTAALNQQGVVYSVVDQEDQVHASGLLVWDTQCLYFLIGGMDERLPQLGASRFLLWKGIQMALQQGLYFDFHGGMVPSVGQVYASLGGQQKMYFRAVRYYSPFIKLAIQTAKRIYAPNDQLFH